MKKKFIIFLSYYKFPCYEPALESIFAKELGKSLNILWIFQGGIQNGKIKRWHNSIALICREIKGKNRLIKSINRLLAIKKYLYLLAILRKKKVKIIVIRDLPLQTLLISPLRKIFKFKIYFQYTAPLGEINIGYFKSIKTLTRYWNFFIGIIYQLTIKQALRTSDFVFPISEFHKKDLNLFINNDKLIVISMGVDEDWLNRNRKEIHFLKELKKDNFLITYFGTLSFSRNPLFIIKMFRKLKDRYKNCKLLLIGKAANKWEIIALKHLTKKVGLENDIVYTGHISRNLLKDYLSYCDISICAIPPENYFRISSPTKLYESLGNGVPVIANRGILEQEKVIENSKGGLIVDYDEDDFSDAILKLIKDSELRKNMGEYGRKYVLNNYSYKVIANDILTYFI